jgi:hypothetical protein
MSKLTSFILCFALFGCETEPKGTAQPKGNRIQFKEYNYSIDASLSIVAVDSIEFLVNHRTGHMVRITKGGNQ